MNIGHPTSNTIEDIIFFDKDSIRHKLWSIIDDEYLMTMWVLLFRKLEQPLNRSTVISHP